MVGHAVRAGEGVGMEGAAYCQSWEIGGRLERQREETQAPCVMLGLKKGVVVGHPRTQSSTTEVRWGHRSQLDVVKWVSHMAAAERSHRTVQATTLFAL